MIPFFEWKQELYTIICLLLIPILCCMIVCYIKTKLLWLSPIFILAASILVSYFFYPYYFEDISTGEYDFTTIYWLFFFIPLQIMSAVFFTGITYIILKFLRRKRKGTLGQI